MFSFLHYKQNIEINYRMTTKNLLDHFIFPDTSDLI